MVASLPPRRALSLFLAIIPKAGHILGEAHPVCGRAYKALPKMVRKKLGSSFQNPAPRETHVVPISRHDTCVRQSRVLKTARTGRKTEVSYMLITHINRLEKHLLSTSQLPASADHAAPRDILVNEFLQNHVSQKLAIGEGIIIDSDSKINGTYNQIDIVLYKPEFPKIRLPKNVDGFLAESVLATIEINSMLEEDDVLHSVKVARDVKALKRSLATAFTTGYHPPGILNFLVA